MKHNSIFIGTLVLFSAMSCQRVNQQNDAHIATTSQHIEVTINKPEQTRLSFNDLESGVIELNWQLDDSFTVYSDKGQRIGNFVYSGAIDGDRATFVAEAGMDQLIVGQNYTAVYPATDHDQLLNRMSEDICEVTQIGTSLEHLSSVCRMSDDFIYGKQSVEFTHEMSIMNIKFNTLSTNTLKSVTFTDKGVDYTVNFNNIVGNYINSYVAIKPNIDGVARDIVMTIEQEGLEPQEVIVNTTKVYSAGMRYTANISDQIVGKWEVDRFTVYGGSYEDYNVNKFQDFDDIPSDWGIWVSGEGYYTEKDNQIIFTVKGVNNNGELYGECNHLAGEDGIFANFYYNGSVVNGYNVPEQEKDINHNYRKIPAGKSTWTRIETDQGYRYKIEQDGFIGSQFEFFDSQEVLWQGAYYNFLNKSLKFQPLEMVDAGDVKELNYQAYDIIVYHPRDLYIQLEKL